MATPIDPLGPTVTDETGCDVIRRHPLVPPRAQLWTVNQMMDKSAFEQCVYARTQARCITSYCVLSECVCARVHVRGLGAKRSDRVSCEVGHVIHNYD